MSIAEQAEQEAENRWPAGGELPDMLYPRVAVRDNMRGSFVAGAEWQASREPTGAEIEAAAIAAYKYYFDSRGNPITLEIAKHDVQRFNGSTDEFSDPDVNYARNIATVVLTAARKAVAE